MRCPNWGASALILRLETAIGFEVDYNGVPTRIILSDQNIRDAEEMRPDYQQSAEFHCNNCHSSFCVNIVGPGERYIVGKEI